LRGNFGFRAVGYISHRLNYPAQQR